MASSAGTPGPPSNASEEGEKDSKSPPSPPSDSSSSPNQGKSPPPANSGSKNNSSDGGDNNKNNNNNDKNSTAPSASQPPPSPPQSASPPPASPPPSKSGSAGDSGGANRSPPPKGSPPPASPPPSSSSSSSSSTTPASPPPSSSSSQTSPPPSNSAPADQSSKSPPPASGGQSSAAASSLPPPDKNQPTPAGSNTAPTNNANTDSGASKWGPPAQPGSPPVPVSSTPSGTSTPTSNSASNALSPPTGSGSPTSKASPQGSSTQTTASSGQTPTGSSKSSSPSTTSSSDNRGTIIGATVAGVFVVALIAIFFSVRGRRKRRDHYRTQYMPPLNHFPDKADGYYYSQNYPPMGHSGPMDAYYGSQVQQSPMGHSFGSQRGGNGYGGGSDSGVIAVSKSFFTYEELMEITNGFSRDNVVGEGGFGYVYKGVLQDRKEVAVKQLKAGSGQGEREFRAEVEIISRVHHRHLVSLVGYCISDRNRLLIYDFLPNKTLEHHLHDKGLPVLEWFKRLKIALGAAKGLAYLHEDCHPKIIHRDIKTANILLDNSFEAQVADFGLAKLNDSTQTHVSTRVMGTFGYLAPEYASSGKLTDRSDVFSFGVVLLELITGRKPVDPTQPLGDESLVEWARPHLVHAVESGDMSDLVDPRLEKHYVESEMLRMIEAAAACVRHSAPKRPRMVQVVRALDCEEELSDLSNGVKYGQSTIYDSGQYNQDIMMFRKMALGFDSSDMSGDYTSRNVSCQQSSEFTSGESETQAINQHTGDQRQNGSQGCYNRRF